MYLGASFQHHFLLYYIVCFMFVQQKGFQLIYYDGNPMLHQLDPLSDAEHHELKRL